MTPFDHGPTSRRCGVRDGLPHKLRKIAIGENHRTEYGRTVPTRVFFGVGSCWSKRLRAATSIFAAFRPLFRHGGTGPASIPFDQGITAATRSGAADRRSGDRGEADQI